MNRSLLFSAAALVFMLYAPAEAHRSGCHRWHSCPSDTGSYICGDLGYTTFCPAKQGPRQAATASAAPPASADMRRTTTNLNLRAGPSSSTAKVATLATGTRVRVAGCTGGWCRVSVNGHTGYVSQKYLR